MRSRSRPERPTASTTQDISAVLKAREAQLSVEHLRSAIRALNEKLKLLENVDEDRHILGDQLEQSDLARSELRSNIRETAERIKDEKEKSNKYQGILINENQSLSKQILIITEMFAKKVEEADEKKAECALMEKDRNTLSLEAASYVDYSVKWSRERTERETLAQELSDANGTIKKNALEFQETVTQINFEKAEMGA